MEVKHNAVCTEATRAPTCELMRGPMLLSEAQASLQLLPFLLGERTHMRGTSLTYVAWIRPLKEGFFRMQRSHKSLSYTNGRPRAHTWTRTQRTADIIEGSSGTKDHSKAKAQMTPSCGSLNCSCSSLSLNISNAFKKET